MSGTTNRLPYVFVVGCPRSGTTLLQRMLDNHPQLAVANDTHFIPRVVDPAGGDVPVSGELVERILGYHRFARLGLDDTAVRNAADTARTYVELVSNIYAEFAKQHGKPLAGEKTPDYVRYLPFLHRLFPSARVVHIVRDGRDVALSALDWARRDKGPGRFELWAESPVAVCALWWRWQVMSGEADGRAIHPQYQLVQFEALVADPHDAMQQLSAFLGLAFAPEMLAFHVGKQRTTPGLSAKSAWLPPTAGLRDWQSQMPGDDVALFEVLAGDALDAFGYPRAVEKPTSDIRRLADEYRRRWQEEMRRRKPQQRTGAG